MWVDNKEQITIAKDEKEDKVEAVTVNIKGAKIMKDFLKMIKRKRIPINLRIQN